MGIGGGKFDAGDVVTATRVNQKMTLIDTGTNINAFASPQNGMQAFATDTSSVFVGANWYYYNGAWFPRQGFRGTGAQIAALITNGMAYHGLSVYCTSTGSGYVIDHAYFYDGSAFQDTLELINPIFKTYGRWHVGPINTIAALSTSVAGAGATITDSGLGINMSSASTVNSTVLFTRGDTTRKYALRRDRKFELNFLIFSSDNESLDFEFGVSDKLTAVLSGDNDDFAVFYRRDNISDNIFLRTNDGGAVAPAGVDTGVPYALNTPYKLSIISNEATIEFGINGTLVHTATTDLPTASTLMLIKGLIVDPTGSGPNVRVAEIEAWSDAA